MLISVFLSFREGIPLEQNRKWLFVVLLLLFLLLTANACHRKEPIDINKLPTTFKAKMNSGFEIFGQIQENSTVLSRKGKNVRMETAVAGQTLVAVQNVDQKKLYLINVSQKSFIEGPLEEQKTEQTDPLKKFLDQPGLKIEELEPETFEGHPCRKLQLTVKKDGKEEKCFVWCATDLKNFPVRIESKTGNQRNLITFSDVSFEVPDEAFLPPADFKLVTVPPGQPANPQKSQ